MHRGNHFFICLNVGVIVSEIQGSSVSLIDIDVQKHFAHVLPRK